MKDLFSLTPENLQTMQIVDWGYTEQMQATSFDKLQNWVENNEHEPLGYLADERMLKRKNLELIYPFAKSAFVFLFDYTSSKKSLEELAPENKVASYALGFEDQDYHYWIQEKLHLIQAELKKEVGEFEFGISLDIHPVLERDLAYRSGLGWFGKNSMLISRSLGSYFLIGSIIIDRKLNLNQRELETDHCGSCTRCLEACPTKAINNDRTVNAKKCISTYTIELFKDAPAPEGYPTATHEVFGCDICQEVCPWNLKPMARADETQFSENSLIEFFNRPIEVIYDQVNQMSNREYKRFFAKTSLERLGKKGLLKNLDKFITD
ncbi:MAG: tRNA epoxyqueuosine(34) reductase QueG [Halobacteriovoraceae bacterium]|nr:tRNA epoxyqueuosine(34) reductase QueG [Halobacteriovoraceae bacterium]|tara:strand:+ start:10800 stop:11765 length:966 start_codon:yes stop_codon:yes gene_type:complete